MRGQYELKEDRQYVYIEASDAANYLACLIKYKLLTELRGCWWWDFSMGIRSGNHSSSCSQLSHEQDIAASLTLCYSSGHGQSTGAQPSSSVCALCLRRNSSPLSSSCLSVPVLKAYLGDPCRPLSRSLY